ncbi:Biotin/lipoate A/B protein ligase [Actinomortierella wolfii]|nr:Biotin/lipoate A/B protein ligase [Actinomortierella wolfii]
MARDNVPFVRRKSGGGTVYHDMGNTNYSIMMPREVFDRKTNVELVCRALHELDIPAIVNDRHDIVLEGKKVSGSAYKLIQHRSYHHGTMLIDTDLTTLGQYLKCERETLVTKGVASFRSPVTRLRDHSFTIDHLPFCEAVRDEFLKRYALDRWKRNEEDEFTIVDEAYIEKLPAVQKLRDEMKTWEWMYGQTPEFTYTLDKAFSWGNAKFSIKAKEGKFVSVDVDTSQAMATMPLTALCVGMEGQRYGATGLEMAVKRIETEAPEVLSANGGLYVQQAVAWLREAL